MNKMAQKSLVKVWFPERHISLTYYNDQFDLEVGDTVFVEGHYAGYQGRVVEVSTTFKIKKSEYKKVIAVADTEISGEVLFLEKIMFAEDRTVIPFEKVRTWFLPPVAEDEEEYEFHFGEEEEISLHELEKMKIDPIIRERGEDYFEDEKIAYVELRGTYLRAIVLGSKPYEVTARFCDGKVSEILCNCPYPGTCKHEYALLLFLKEAKKALEEEYCENLDSLYLAIMPKSTFFEYTVWNKKRGCLKFE